MTDKPTAEQIALAREIVERWAAEDFDGQVPDIPDSAGVMQCALAAIIETTERNAKLAETQTERATWDDQEEEARLYGFGYEQACADIATALRAGDHLK